MFEDLCKQLRIIAGQPLALLLSIADGLKARAGIHEVTNVIEETSGKYKKGELFSWCCKILNTIMESKNISENDGEPHKFVYQLMTVVYKCTSKNKDLMHYDHRNLIEGELLKVWKPYFLEYGKYQHLIRQWMNKTEDKQQGKKFHNIGPMLKKQIYKK